MPARPSADTIEGASGVGVSDTTYHRVTLSEYLTRVAGPRAILRDVALSGFDQAIGRPKEWPKNWRGYGDRVSSRAASQAISQTILLGLSASLDQRRAEFTLCGCTDRSDRAVHAMLTPLRVGTSGGTRLSPLVPVSEISGAILVTSVHPGGLSVRDGLLGGVTGLAGSSLVALGREFWPWKRRPPGV